MTIQIVALSVVWLILSGHYDLFHLCLGALSIGLVVFLNRTVPSVLPGQATGERLRFLLLLAYIPWLGKEMMMSAFHVAAATLHPRLRISPSVIRFKSDQPTPLAHVILANSITLTPGTLTVDLEDGEYLVHALTKGSAEGLLGGTMQRKVAQLFGGGTAPERLIYDVRQESRGEES